MAIHGLGRWAVPGLLALMLLGGCGDKDAKDAGKVGAGRAPAGSGGGAAAKPPAPDPAVDMTKPEAVVRAWVLAFKAGNLDQADAYVLPGERASAHGAYPYVAGKYPSDPQLKAGEVKDIGGTKYVRVEVTNAEGVAPWVRQVDGKWMVTVNTPTGPR